MLRSDYYAIKRRGQLKFDIGWELKRKEDIKNIKRSGKLNVIGG